MTTAEQRAALTQERAELSRKLAVRERAGMGYGQNVAAIKARIAVIDTDLAAEEAAE